MAKEPVTVAIVLGHRSVDSRVLINGEDITSSVYGVEIRAFVGETSRVTLTLRCRAEITGEAEVTSHEKG